MARSALIAPETFEHAGRRFLARRQWQRVGQVVQVVLARDEIAGHLETIDRSTVRQRGEDGDRAAPVGDLDGLSALDQAEQLACPLPEFTHPDANHVLFVARN